MCGAVLVHLSSFLALPGLLSKQGALFLGLGLTGRGLLLQETKLGMNIPPAGLVGCCNAYLGANDRRQGIVENVLQTSPGEGAAFQILDGLDVVRQLLACSCR